VKRSRNKAKNVHETRKRKQPPPCILLVLLTETLHEQAASKIKQNEGDTPPM
jgi:hypothetical protein